MANQNKVSGWINHHESGIGISNLVVHILDIDPKSFNPDQDLIYVFPDKDLLDEDQFLGGKDIDTGKLLTQSIPADRLGSVVTDENGYFELMYDDDAFQVRKKDVPPGIPAPTVITKDSQDEVRPDLFLVVTVSEESGMEVFENLIYRSNWARVNAGRNESYLIRLTSEQLKKAKISIPVIEAVDNSTNGKISRYKENRIAQKAFRKGIRDYNEKVEEDEKEERQALKKTFKEAILPNIEVLNSMDNFVKESDSIETVQNIVYKKGIDYVDQVITVDKAKPIPGKGIKVNLFLTEEEKEELEEYKFIYQGKDYFNIPENIVQSLLFKREEDDGINTILFSNNPISKYCIEKTTEDKCAAKYTGIDTSIDEEEPEETETTTNGTGISKDDISLYLKKVLFDKDSNPFQSNGSSLSKRPDSASIQDNVDTFSLQKGPADATAFYDFHSLQIAFQYVWQQLLDETLVNLSERVHNNLENSGKKPIVKGGSVIDLHNIMVALENAIEEIPIEVPTDILMAFDISPLEYDALSNDDKIKLLEISQFINAKELSPKWATAVSVKRDQGERLIDNVRVNKPFSTNQMLKELQERLLSKYEFTVFAANKNYQSINFGLMNTFRQKWEPISYQAGKLVKTIPMAPKEERKYSVKTVHKIKATRKQAQKNNSSIEGEISTTSRAESDIVAKAHEKSNFNMSVNVSYSGFSSQVGFVKDAEKETTQNRKDFREAVIKSAQEYKEERSIQIDTEESFDSEYNESGTIVNPNDELSVTYLFYELQRRYRVSEQLYRVMPVVMVAQEVPAPHQITKAWIITHDWIINRVLLDDSFRTTLQYIAQKNVGDDFAIRELRKNLRQQRTLLNNLKIEFSKLKQDVEDKYAGVQSSIQERIEEEHDKRFYKRWWWWGFPHQVHANQEEPPDPEMAKAIEQSAADDHKHAVEQAKEMAMSVQREIMSLNQLTTQYNNAMQRHWDLITQTRRLITHIKENILYYMQAIWNMEPPDQRYMRLYKVRVPYFDADRTCIVASEPIEDIFADFRTDSKKKYPAWLHGKIKRKANGSLDVTYKQLVEVADLDTVLGFKGNYMIFPLKEHNALTELMAAPYIDDAFGAMDPDELSNINLEEYSKYICCLHHEAPEEFERLKPVLKKWLERLLSDPLRNGDEIIVPTDSLFIEMLPSDKSLLEDFKLQHRAWDVKKVQAETREMELENIRLAARLLAEQYDDPDVEKRIEVIGDTKTFINPEGN